MKFNILLIFFIFFYHCYNIHAVLVTHENENFVDKILESYSTSPSKELFKVYHFLFKKEYNLNSEEGILRYRAFKDNLKQIKEVNDRNLSYKFGIGPYSDMTDEEFKSKILINPSLIEQTAHLKSSNIFLENNEIQDNIDWRQYFRFVPNQGNCGSSYSFSSTSALEATYKIQYGDDLALSQQYLVDCDPTQSGCGGGDPQRSLIYIQNNGVPFLNDYPYVGAKQTCKANIPLNKIVQYYEACHASGIKCSYESWLALLSRGPIIASVDSSLLQNYKSGILINMCTSSYKTNFFVVVVGIGNDNDGLGHYLIARYSGGSSWGELGYFRIRVDHLSDTCGLTANGSRPVIQKVDVPIPIPPTPRCPRIYSECSGGGNSLDICQSTTNFNGMIAKGMSIGDYISRIIFYPFINCFSGSSSSSLYTGDNLCTTKTLNSAYIDDLSNPPDGCVWLFDNYCQTGRKLELCESNPDLSSVNFSMAVASFKLGIGVKSIILRPEINYRGSGINYSSSSVSIFMGALDKNAKSIILNK